MTLRILAILCLQILAGPAGAVEIANNVVALGLSGTRGSSIDSLKIKGTEVLNNTDLGRQIQQSLFFLNANTPHGMDKTCNEGPPPWLNPQDAGDECGNPSTVYALGTDPRTAHVGAYPREWHGRGRMPGLRLEGHHTVGPLPYLDADEVIRLRYQIFWDAAYAGQPNLMFQHVVGAANGDTPVPFLPHAYLDANVLQRLFGLSMDGSLWIEVTQSTQADGQYSPSLYRFRAMAYMRQDLGWGIGLYGRWTLNQSCHSVTFIMALPDQRGQCPNFAAQRYPSLGTNNVSIVDQTLTSLPVGHVAERTAHLAVGNLDTIQVVVNRVHDSGN